jgi:acyl carrier protein
MKGKIIKIIAEELALMPSEIMEDLHYNSIPEWDSVAHMSLVSAFEAEFDISFQNEEIAEMTTITAINDIISKHVAASWKRFHASTASE